MRAPQLGAMRVVDFLLKRIEGVGQRHDNLPSLHEQAERERSLSHGRLGRAEPMIMPICAFSVDGVFCKRTYQQRSLCGPRRLKKGPYSTS